MINFTILLAMVSPNHGQSKPPPPSPKKNKPISMGVSRPVDKLEEKSIKIIKWLSLD